MFKMHQRVLLVAGQYAGQQGKINILPVNSKSDGYGVLLENGRGLDAIPASALSPIGATPKNHPHVLAQAC